MKTLLIAELTIKSYLQFISLKKLFSQNTIYSSFQFSLKKLVPLKMYIFKKNSIKKRFIPTKPIYELVPLSHMLG